MQLIRIPQASENLEAATVGKWLKVEGDEVHAGEEVVEILTDKADFALEAEESGWLRRTTAVEKSTVPVGYILGIIAGKDEPLPEIDSENRALMQAVELQPAAEEAGAVHRPSFGGRKIAATPAARRLAREHGIDLADVAAAVGRKGALTADDVEQYLQQQR